MGGISENLSRVIDTYLQPYVLSMPSFVKDTIHFLQTMPKHMYSMQIGNRCLPMSRHAVFGHDYKVPKVSFTVLDRVHIPDRGGDWNKILLQHEQRWICRLQATIFPGLNKSISFAPFLKGFSSGKTH